MEQYTHDATYHYMWNNIISFFVKKNHIMKHIIMRINRGTTDFKETLHVSIWFWVTSSELALQYLLDMPTCRMHDKAFNIKI